MQALVETIGTKQPMIEGTLAPAVGRTTAGVLPVVTGPAQLMRQRSHNGQATQSIT